MVQWVKDPALSLQWLGGCCGLHLIAGPGTPASHRYDRKKEKKKMIQEPSSATFIERYGLLLIYTFSPLEIFSPVLRLKVRTNSYEKGLCNITASYMCVYSSNSPVFASKESPVIYLSNCALKSLEICWI